MTGAVVNPVCSSFTETTFFSSYLSIRPLPFLLAMVYHCTVTAPFSATIGDPYATHPGQQQNNVGMNKATLSRYIKQGKISAKSRKMGVTGLTLLRSIGCRKMRVTETPSPQPQATSGELALDARNFSQRRIA